MANRLLAFVSNDELDRLAASGAFVRATPNSITDVGVLKREMVQVRERGVAIDREEFVRSVKMLLQGRLPTLPEYPVCAECKMQENPCVYGLGGTCLGPVTRAGCGAICPTYRTGCEGCRGLAPGANLTSLRAVLTEHGLEARAADDSLRLFLGAELDGRES